MTPEDSTGPFKIHDESLNSGRVRHEYVDDDRFSKRPAEQTPAGLPNRLKSRSLMIGIVVIVLFLLILLFWSIPKPKRVLNDPRLAAMQTRISQIEKRLHDVEGTLAGFAEIKAQLSDTQELAGRLDHIEAAYSKRLAGISKKIDGLDKALKSTPKQPGVKKARTSRAKTARKPTIKKHAIHYHAVTAGETLYGIAKHYGLTVAKLRGINKLGSKSTIHPGQKLRVSP